MRDLGNGVHSRPELLKDWEASVLQSVVSPPRRPMTGFQDEGDFRGIRSIFSRWMPRPEQSDLPLRESKYEQELKAYEDTKARLDRDPALRQKLVKEYVEKRRSRIDGLGDPFSPIARGEERARRGEVILWEDQRTMVLLDRFSGTHTLVVPKERLEMPVDAAPARIDELAKIAEATSEAYSAVLGSGPAKAWINIPSGLSEGQLHVHVAPPASYSRRELEDTYDRLTAELVKRLGPQDKPALVPSPPEREQSRPWETTPRPCDDGSAERRWDRPPRWQIDGSDWE
jgi:diadenosine tetraphosphate (Ap4A) HIT family hydrolase